MMYGGFWLWAWRISAGSQTGIAERSKVPNGQKLNLCLSRTTNSLNQTNGRYGFPILWGLLGDD